MAKKKAKKPKKEKLTYGKLFWTYYNAHDAERKSKAKWAYDIVKYAVEHGEPEKDVLWRLEDLILQAERVIRWTASEIAERHGQMDTKYAIEDMHSEKCYAHFSKCEPCLENAIRRYEYFRDVSPVKYSDKCPWGKD